MNEIWIETFDKMSSADRSRLTRCIHMLLSHTYFLSDVYDDKDKILKSNPDYRLVDRYFDWVQKYLEMAGWSLRQNRNLGVIYVESEYGSDRVRLNQLTTLFLLAIRLLYDEEREKLTLRKEIELATDDVVKRLISFGSLAKKPSDTDITEAFRALSRFRLVQKMEGEWKDAECRFLVYPSISLVIDGDIIRRIYDSLANTDEEELSDSDSNAEQSSGLDEEVEI